MFCNLQPKAALLTLWALFGAARSSLLSAENELEQRDECLLNGNLVNVLLGAVEYPVLIQTYIEANTVLNVGGVTINIDNAPTSISSIVTVVTTTTQTVTATSSPAGVTFILAVTVGTTALKKRQSNSQTYIVFNGGVASLTQDPLVASPLNIQNGELQSGANFIGAQNSDIVTGFGALQYYTTLPSVSTTFSTTIGGPLVFSNPAFSFNGTSATFCEADNGTIYVQYTSSPTFHCASVILIAKPSLQSSTTSSSSLVAIGSTNSIPSSSLTNSGLTTQNSTSTSVSSPIMTSLPSATLSPTITTPSLSPTASVSGTTTSGTITPSSSTTPIPSCSIPACFAIEVFINGNEGSPPNYLGSTVEYNGTYLASYDTLPANGGAVYPTFFNLVGGNGSPLNLRYNTSSAGNTLQYLPYQDNNLTDISLETDGSTNLFRFFTVNSIGTHQTAGDTTLQITATIDVDCSIYLSLPDESNTLYVCADNIIQLSNDPSDCPLITLQVAVGLAQLPGGVGSCP